MSKHNFGEHTEEYSAKQKAKIPVWQSPKYQEAREKAIEMIDSGKYGLTDGDFWILMNETRSGKMGYTGLIISHNGCLKINDSLPDDKRFKPRCVELDKDGWGESLVYTYNCNEQGVYEVGEFSKSNGKNAYPYAMALKRMFDRVILKTSRLAYSGVYSESESDDFRDTRDAPAGKAKSRASANGDLEEIIPCSDCACVIESVKRRDGSPWTVKDMVAYSTGRFGRPLCAECMKKVQKAEAQKAKEALAADAEAHGA